MADGWRKRKRKMRGKKSKEDSNHTYEGYTWHKQT